MFPVRCYTCNVIIAQLYPDYVARCRRGENVGDVLNDMNVDMMCCRRMFISHVEGLTVSQMEYPNEDKVMDRGGTVLYRRCSGEHDMSCD